MLSDDITAHLIPVRTVFRWSLEVNFKASVRDSLPSILATKVSSIDCSEDSDFMSAPGRHSMMSATLQMNGI